MTISLRFLFQIGAIKTSRNRLLRKLDGEFLFQIGAIKTYQAIYTLSDEIMFLFQIGAIKTLILFATCASA